MTGIGSYSSATAFRQALEDRLKAEALHTGVPYDRLRKEAAFHRLLARLQRVAPQDRRASEGSEKPSGDARGDEGVAIGGGMDRLSKQVGPGIFEQEAARAGLQGSVHVLVKVEGGDHDNGQRVVDISAGELAGGLDTV